MAAKASKVVVVSETASFGGATIKFQSAPPGVPETADLPDITCCDDVEQRFAPSALTEDGEFTIKADSAPALNTKAALTLSQKISVGGAAATTKTVSCGDCILTKITPVDIEAEGDRVQWYELTFRPDGNRS